MPIIERKSLDRLNRDDVLYFDAGNLIKAGNRIGENIPVLARYNVSHVTVISLTREEAGRYGNEDAQRFLEDYIEKQKRKNHYDLKFKLKNTVMDFHEVYSEKDQVFQLSGKRNYLEENELLSRKTDPLNDNQIQTGSLKIIDQHKLKYSVELLTRISSFYDKLKPIEKGDKEARGLMNRIHMNSIRMNSTYDGSKLTSMGDSIVNQSIDIALLFIHTFININKKRIIEGRPFSESRWDPSQGKSEQKIYQYKPELIIEAATGILLHNLGCAHHTVHRIISGKPFLSSNDEKELRKIKQIQKSVYVPRHLLDRDDVSSISRMICLMQKDYPDGTGAPAPNENRYLFEFIRLFQIIEFYDRMTNPVMTKTVFSRMDVINHIIDNSGEYRYNPDKFNPQMKFDSNLVQEFLNVLAPYDINEKVYLYEKGKRSYPLFVGKVVSYPDSHFPLVAILKDEKKNRTYRDGQIFLHVPSSSIFIRSAKSVEKKKYSWVGNLDIYDKNTNPGNIDEYIDTVFGSVRPVHVSKR